jgi:mannose-6-phosphate isomerase-like protein (cupin superfamily)
MRIVKGSEAKKFEDGAFVAHEYETHDADINLAKIEINGRFPATGTMRNTKVKEIIYVEAGKGSVTINGAQSEIEKGDVIFYDKNEEVFWEGELVLITVCTPAWTKEQHEMLK